MLYKMTTADHKTRKGQRNECVWGDGVSHSGTGEGALCGLGWIHAYTDPLLAVLLNPIHANIDNPVLWEAEGEVALSDGGLKVGCRTLTTLRQIPLPAVTPEQRVRFAILCAKAVYDNPAWNAWADKWLDGSDRSEAAAEAAEAAAAAEAAWAARAARAARAAEWAAGSARAAEWAAEAEADIDLITLAREACK